MYCKSSITLPGGGGGGGGAYEFQTAFQTHLSGGLIETRGLFNLEETMVSVLHLLMKNN